MSFDRFARAPVHGFSHEWYLALTRITAAPSMHRWPLACIPVQFAEGTHIGMSARFEPRSRGC